MKMSEAFLPHVKASKLKKIVSITSQAGSFALDSGDLPGMYFYKSSKAAQNMIMRNIAKDVKEHGIIVGIERISWELAARFAEDALSERYFGFDPKYGGRGEHNLVRARGQAAMARSVRAHRDLAAAALARARAAT